MFVRPGLLLLSLLLAPQAAQLKKEKKDSNVHPGTIVDAYSRVGILAHAYAYGSQEQKSGGDCPVYGDSLDTQQSESTTGAFIFHIQKDKSGFLAVYCQPGYASRTETTNDNSTDGTRVQPDPVKLFPLKAKLPPGIMPSTAAFVAIATDMDQLRSNLRYYAKASPSAFSEALKLRFMPADRDLVEAITKRPEPFMQGASPEARPRIKDTGNPDVAFVAIAIDLYNARSNLIYYEVADKDAYTTARSKFPSQDQRIIERIKTRPASFLVPNTMPNTSRAPAEPSEKELLSVHASPIRVHRSAIRPM